jgi:cell filamentation protein
MLADVEALITTLNIAKLEVEPIVGNFDYKHYCDIHFFIYNELYDWAGKTRTIDITKKGTVFCTADKIEQQAILIFKRLKSENYFLNKKPNDFIADIVDFYVSTNYLHPFREGNGRSQRAFLTQIIRAANYDINFSEIDVDLLMLATIKSASGVNDMLLDIFSKFIKTEKMR